MLFGKYLTISALSCLIVIACGKQIDSSADKYGLILETFESGNGKVTVHVTTYQERNPVFLHHFFYVFEAEPMETKARREIMTIRQNDDRPIPRDQVRFLSDEIVYVFMNSKFAVSSDHGGTWSVWDAERALQDWRQSYLSIKDVRIDINGNGTLTLLPFEEGQGKSTDSVFYTKDYGRHWSQ